MLSRMLSAALFGIDATVVSVEVHGSPGLPAVNTVGLPDIAVRESRERVRSAILNSGFTYPQRRITVNLAPAGIRKAGSSLDLPVALAILALQEGVIAEPIQETVLSMGELSLDGAVRSVPGVLSAALEARDRRIGRVLVPVPNVPEASVVKGIAVVGVISLAHAVSVLNGDDGAVEAAGNGPVAAAGARAPGTACDGGDMSDVRGQVVARRALEVAAAGGHNILLIGPPGAGKTMLARRLPTILPPIGVDEAIEVTRIHGAAGVACAGLASQRPFRAPHHTASDVALIGGGGGPSGVRPGEVSLAHEGVLFLDELPEFHRHVMEVLRQPLEDRFVTVARASRTARFPAAFTLVAAMNPCPCGFLGGTTRECSCTPPMIARYRGRISGPLLDRIDLHVEVASVPYAEIASDGAGETSETIRERVAVARARQRTRVAESPCNARTPTSVLRRWCRLDEAGRDLMQRAVDRLGLSARAHDRILKVARTIADMEAEERIAARHVAEAVQYRMLDRAPRID